MSAEDEYPLKKMIFFQIFKQVAKWKGKMGHYQGKFTNLKKQKTIIFSSLRNKTMANFGKNKKHD